MYRRKDQQQAEFESFHLSFGKRLRSDNRWMKLSKIVPWGQIEHRYTVQLKQYCSERGVRISGPPLGRPKLSPTREEKRQAHDDERDGHRDRIPGDEPGDSTPDSSAPICSAVAKRNPDR